VGLLGFLAMTADTVGHALDLAVRYHRLLEDAATTRSYRGDGKLVIVFEPEFEGPPIPEAVETALAAYAMLLRAWTDKDARPLEVYFAHGRPSDVDEHHRVFGCPVHFDAEHNALVLSEAVLSISLRTANPELRSYLEALARQRLGEVPEADTLPLQIRDELERGFTDDGPPDLAEIARRLHISVRTLQRRLRERGVGFQQIVDEVRFRRAVVMLAETELPIGQIAQQLGFAEPRGFRRAFRRWSGLSPQAYRAGRN
jgi:AraC-like DNA-binding protein